MRSEALECGSELPHSKALLRTTVLVVGGAGDDERAGVKGARD